MTILDKYVLSQTMRRLMIALSIVLLTLILERVLRLFEFAAANNAAFGLVLQMAANLLPHYLGLALPAAFFISILLLMAQLGDNNELDVILGSGASVRRMARTVIVAGVILSILSVLLLGYLQPYSRYGYRAIRHAATHAVWTEAISAQTFFAPAKGLTILANEIDLDDRGLSGVFVHQISDDGQEMTITAANGQVTTSPDTGETKIVLENVVQIIEQPGQAPYTLYLGKLTFTPDFPFEPTPFRERGNDQRELTLGELWKRNTQPQPGADPKDAIEQTKLNAEVNGRLVRSISVATMPFLAVPMGIAAKRRRRGPAVATAAILLLLYHYSLEVGEGLVGLGVVSPLVGLWVPFGLFSLFCINMFWQIDQRLRPNKFEQFFDRVDSVFQAMKKRIWPKRQPSE
ncbi:LptF/LptG family permease [Tateyamaria pelophila]|uniref:LptF/LptG family permease n=1 Tax=Tateyamaria pelophila TaxID=328415 RepID=UPI001CBFDB11|nr:LptF/LptG family permease [Tateyamaria pelophila]